jgi:hypothetical protein|tara:strand:+ start:7883 stop:8137 length:255 start_codon:yes stop_codon:yes gene_type:complete
MYILAVTGKEKEGAYSVKGESNQLVYMFLDKDDAVRYAGLLEADNFPDMSVVEVDDREIIQACVTSGHEYYVVTPDDIVVPPRE